MTKVVFVVFWVFVALLAYRVVDAQDAVPPVEFDEVPGTPVPVLPSEYEDCNERHAVGSLDCQPPSAVALVALDGGIVDGGRTDEILSNLGMAALSVLSVLIALSWLVSWRRGDE